jgi:hypothetical protein
VEPAVTAAALKPFVKTLGELAPDVAAAMSPWLPRLSLLLGALARAHNAGGDPDGFDGVTRRGRYDRLLLSEWAVALELPDEFLRRAVMNEHLFTEIKRREPQGALHSVVVVDAGPDQLGAPRLLHLAAAIVGEARAKKAKAAFAWGATTEPVRLFPRVDPESARHVLDARRAVPLQAASLERWHAAISRFEKPASEEVTPVVSFRPGVAARPGRPRGAAVPAQVDVLFVGGAHLERLVAASPFAGKARVLRVDALHASLSASIRPAAHAAQPRPLLLPLPDDALAVRALRDPFGVEKKAGPVPTLDVVASSGLVIPMGGRRVLVRTKRGVAALVEPNSPRAPLGAPREIVLAVGDTVLAAGLVGKRPLLIVQDGKGLCAMFAGERHRLEGDLYPILDGDPIDGVFVAPPDRMRALWPVPGEVPFESDKTPTPIPEVGGTPRAFLERFSVGGTRGYALLPFHRRVVELADGHLLPPLMHKGDVLVVKNVAGNVSVKANSAVRLLKVGDVERAYLGAFRAHGRVPGVLALAVTGGAWVLVNGASDDVANVVLEAPSADVIGAIQHPTLGACLVAREDARRLAFIGKGAIERHSFASEIIEVAPNLELPQLAVLTKDGSVTLIYLKNGVRSLICRGMS